MNDDAFPKSVTVFEVGPRDGLQNQPEFIATDKKIEFINMLTAAGCQRIEMGSFVHPKWVPQLRDIKEVFAGIEKRPGVTYSAFVPNVKGLELAIDVGIKEVVNIISASESHNKKNLNRTIAQSLDELGRSVETAHQNGIKFRSYIGTSFGCPMEGSIPASRVVEIARAMDDAGVYEISLADTTGMSNPVLTHRVVREVIKNLKRASVALHVHRFEGIEFANVLAGLQAGVTVFDAAAGGLGGCPYAPGATGNIATEWLVEMLERMGISTGIGREKIRECGKFAQGLSAHSCGQER